MNRNRTLEHAKALELLKKGRYGVLSTVSADGRPYGVPVNYIYVPEDNALYFHCARAGKKLDNIAGNSGVSFVVIGGEQIIEERFITHYESVIVTGTASLLTQEAQVRRVLERLCTELAPTARGRSAEVIEQYLPAVAIVKITIDTVTGKKNRDD